MVMTPCDIHKTEPHIDAIRGPVCSQCDAANDAYVSALPRRLWLALKGLVVRPVT